jgi:hypothetical protein
VNVPPGAASTSSKGTTSVKVRDTKDIHIRHCSSPSREEEIWRRTHPSIFVVIQLLKILHSTIIITTKRERGRFIFLITRVVNYIHIRDS